MAALLCRIVLIMVSAIFHRPAGAITGSDYNRVLIAYNAAFDNCGKITEISGGTAKAAADKSCEQAFESLDKIKENTCHGWRSAECRLLDDYQEPQCTCLIADCDGLLVRTKVVRAFRDCAASLWTQELDTGVVPAPSSDFQQARSKYDDAMELARIRRAYSYSDLYGGSSSLGDYSLGAGTSGGLYYSGGTHDPISAGYSNWVPLQSYPENLNEAYYPISAGYSTGVPLQSVPENFSEANPSYAPAGLNLSANPVQSGAPMMYSCPVCSNIYSSLHELADHMKVHPANVGRQATKSVRKFKDSGAVRHVCDKCGRSYSLKRSLLAHHRSHRTLDTYCIFCDKTLVSKPSYQNHMQKIHPEFVAAQTAAARSGPSSKCPEKERRFVCSECGRSYVKERYLKVHERSHTTLETYCIVCKRFFASKYGYWDHMQRKHPTLLAVHKETAKEKRVVGKTEICKTCGKAFKPGRGLRDHQKSHEGATQCDICGKHFARVSSVRVHKKTAHKK